jgi:hypothetical protein
MALGDARRSPTAQHRDEEGKVATPAGGGGSGETHLLIQLVGNVARGEEEERGSNGVGRN